MPENPWGPQDAPETRQWQPHQSPPVEGPAPVGGSRGAVVGLVLAVTAAVLALAAVAGVVWFFLSGRDDGGATVATTSAVSAPRPAPHTTAGDTPAAPTEQDLPEGLTRSGWTGVADARCTGSDNWVYAARNTTTYVVVCRDGRDSSLYYRALAVEGALEITDGVRARSVPEGSFDVRYPPSWIDIKGTTLTIHNEDGSVWGVESFPRYWADDAA